MTVTFFPWLFSLGSLKKVKPLIWKFPHLITETKKN